MKRITTIIMMLMYFFQFGISQTIDTISKDLPSYFSVLTKWGLRPEWDEMGENVYFLNKLAGDVFRINIRTREVTCITSGFYHAGIFRALCLQNGDLLLGIGGRIFDPSDPEKQRHRLEMYILKKDDPKKPFPLGEYFDEGPAVSRNRLKIAYTLPGQREIMLADIHYNNGIPELINKKIIVTYKDSSEYVRLETQDFRPPDDNELLYTHYWGDSKDSFHHSEVFGYNIVTGKTVKYTNLPHSYNEAEGVFPDGKSILVESDRHQALKDRNKYKLDVYRLPLDGKDQPVRLADFSTRYPGILRSDNPVVDKTGKYIALQFGLMKGSGDGKGIFLFDVEKFERSVSR